MGLGPAEGPCNDFICQTHLSKLRIRAVGGAYTDLLKSFSLPGSLMIMVAIIVEDYQALSCELVGQILQLDELKQEIVIKTIWRTDCNTNGVELLSESNLCPL